MARAEAAHSDLRGLQVGLLGREEGVMMKRVIICCLLPFWFGAALIVGLWVGPVLALNLAASEVRRIW